MSVRLTHAMVDKGYDNDSIRSYLTAHDIVPMIPPKCNRTTASGLSLSLLSAQADCAAARYNSCANRVLLCVCPGGSGSAPCSWPPSSQSAVQGFVEHICTKIRTKFPEASFDICAHHTACRRR